MSDHIKAGFIRLTFKNTKRYVYLDPTTIETVFADEHQQTKEISGSMIQFCSGKSIIVAQTPDQIMAMVKDYYESREVHYDAGH